MVKKNNIMRGGKNPFYEHGYSKHPLYNKWRKMKARCYNPNQNGYHRYGGRGIKICPEWIDDPKAFIEWALANGWKPGLQIDRIDNDGDYCPENCRFVTLAKNCNNRPIVRSRAKLNPEQVRQIRKTIKEEDLTQREIAELYGISRQAVTKIINHKTWADVA